MSVTKLILLMMLVETMTVSLNSHVTSKRIPSYDGYLDTKAGSEFVLLSIECGACSEGQTAPAVEKANPFPDTLGLGATQVRSLVSPGLETKNDCVSETRSNLLDWTGNGGM
jgi:hypothetical protein